MYHEIKILISTINYIREIIEKNEIEVNNIFKNDY